MRQPPARLSLLLSAMSAMVMAAPLSAGAQAVSDAAPTAAPAAGISTPLPQIRLPFLDDVQLTVPRSVRAATAALGLGRQRLALVVGIASNGALTVLDSAQRDTQAVAAALRSSGFVVMLREDLGAADLRANLKEFRDRLQPGAVGFIYAAALGAQVDGHNLLLPRDAVLDPAAGPVAVAAQLRSAAVPVSEFVDALTGPADSPRLLVVDAAWRHAALSQLPMPGLAEQRLPPGLMALFGHALGAAKEIPAVAPLPLPAPTEPAEIAATAFAGGLVKALTTPRISGPEALRATRRSVMENSRGLLNPWLGGDTDASEEFAEATLLDGLLPRSPEEIARESGRQVVRLGSRPAGRAGEQTVAQVLEQSAEASTTQASASGESSSRPPETARRTVPEPPASGAANLLSAAGTAVGAVGTLASVAAGVAATAAVVRVAQTAAVAELAATALGTAGALGGQMMALALAPAAATATTATTAAVATTSAAATVATAAPAASTAALPAATSALQPTVVPDVSPNAQRLAQAAASTLAQSMPESEQARAQPPRAEAPASDSRTRRNPEGGERPAYVPRSNSFGYAEGDTFTYRVSDTWKGEVTGQYTTAIDHVLGDGQILANGHQLQLDPQGRLIKSIAADGSFTRFEPFQDLWWSNPQRGQSRAVKFVESFGRGDAVRGQTEWSGSTSVGRARKVQTPAGEFDALPIESSGWWTRKLSSGGAAESGQWSRTVWYSPKLGHPVAIDIEDADRLGKLLKRERVELLHAQSARQ